MKRIIPIIFVGLLFASPSFSYAQTITVGSPEWTSLITQLISLLQQELQIMLAQQATGGSVSDNVVTSTTTNSVSTSMVGMPDSLSNRANYGNPTAQATTDGKTISVYVAEYMSDESMTVSAYEGTQIFAENGESDHFEKGSPLSQLDGSPSCGAKIATSNTVFACGGTYNFQMGSTSIAIIDVAWQGSTKTMTFGVIKNRESESTGTLTGQYPVIQTWALPNR